MNINNSQVDMNTVFTELFNSECKDRFNISVERIQEALRIPDAQQIIKLDNLELNFFIKKGDALSNNNRSLLVCSRKENDNLLVDVAFEVPPELIDSETNLEPIIILQKFVQKFGLMMRIGNQFNKFIFKETISVDTDCLDTAKLIVIINPSNHSFMQQAFIKLDQKEDKKILNCSLAYCIDTREYCAYLFDRCMDQKVFVGITPQLRGFVTLRDLIVAEGTFFFSSNYFEIGGCKGGILFKLVSDFYYFEVGFAGNLFYIARNHDKLEYPVQPVYMPVGRFNAFVTWSPTELTLCILVSRQTCNVG